MRITGKQIGDALRYMRDNGHVEWDAFSALRHLLVDGMNQLEKEIYSRVILYRHDGGITSRELADMLGKSHSHIAKTMPTLEECGLLRKEQEIKNGGVWCYRWYVIED